MQSVLKINFINCYKNIMNKTNIYKYICCCYLFVVYKYPLIKYILFNDYSLIDDDNNLINNKY
jgi:hypothetical protein